MCCAACLALLVCSSNRQKSKPGSLRDSMLPPINQQSNWDAIIEQESRVLKVNPFDSLAYVWLGSAHQAKHQLDEAESDFTKAIQLDPQNGCYYVYRGAVYYGQGKCDAALADLDIAIKLDANNVCAYKARATVLDYKHDYAEAIQDWDTALKIAPNDAEALSSRGLAHFNCGKYAEATNDFERALRLNSTNDYTYNNLAWLQATCPLPEFRNKDQAVKNATRGCELTRWLNARRIDTLAASFAEAGEFDSAIAQEKRAIALGEVDAAILDKMKSRLQLFEQHKSIADGRTD